MKQINFVPLLIAIALLLISTTAACANEVVYKKSTHFKLFAGQRTDNLDWNIAGTATGKNPNVLSELVWKDLKIRQIKAESIIDIANDNLPWLRTYLKGTAGYGWIYDGSNRDSDYDADNRSIEVSRSINAADDGSVLDLSIAVGPHFISKDGRWSVVPLLGYSHHEQRLTLSQGYRVIPYNVPIEGLNSTYETEWSGPWLGCDFAYSHSTKWTLTTSFEYHWTDYSADADWNLRNDFQHPKSFEHDADGEGWSVGVDVNYVVTEQLSVGLSADYLDWETDRGRDRLYLANGTVLDTRLNKVNWESRSVSLDLSWAF